MATIISPVTCFQVGSETLKGYIQTKNGSSASAGDSFTQSDVLVYDFYTGSGNQIRTLRFTNLKWIDHNTSDQPVLYDGPADVSNIILQTEQNSQTIYLKWYTTIGDFTNPYYDSTWTAPSFGTVGHQLLNTLHQNKSTSSYWECVSVANNEYLYRRDGSGLVAYNFKYDVSNNQWVDEGTGWPSKFGTSASDSQEITPTNANQYLYLYDGANFVCELEVDYTTSSGSGGGSSGGGPNPLSNNSSSTSSKKVFHNFW